MQIDISYELESFIASLVIGILTGVIYDVLKGIRHISKKRTLPDIILWVSVLFVYGKIWYTYQSGEVRAFMVLGVILSLILYFLICEKYVFFIVLFLMKKICFIFGIIFKIFLTPLRFLCKIYSVYVIKARNKFSRKVED